MSQTASSACHRLGKASIARYPFYDIHQPVTLHEHHHRKKAIINHYQKKAIIFSRRWQKKLYACTLCFLSCTAVQTVTERSMYASRCTPLDVRTLSKRTSNSQQFSNFSPVLLNHNQSLVAAMRFIEFGVEPSPASPSTAGNMFVPSHR